MKRGSGVLLVFDGFEVPPPGPERYEGAIKFRAKVEGKSIPVHVAFGERIIWYFEEKSSYRH